MLVLDVLTKLHFLLNVKGFITDNVVRFVELIMDLGLLELQVKIFLPV